MVKFNRLSVDVFIIGSGGAGLRAAIEANNQGASVILVSKSVLGKAHTVMAEGGISAALGNIDREDNWGVHFKDTMVEGQMISDWRLVKLLVQGAPNRVRELEQLGALFDRTEDGKIAQRFFGAHTYKRACFVGDRIGLEILHTLQDEILRRNIKILDEVFITKIITDRNKVVGVVAIDLKKGEISFIRTKALILATGGCGRLYRITTNSWETTGHGYTLAYGAGAELQDMEMTQFHPTGMVWPKGIAGILVTEAIRAEGGILLNNEGKRFMPLYDRKRMELGPRDVVARAIYTEVIEGRGTEHGGVWLDIRHKRADYIKQKLPRMYNQFKEFAGVDITKEPMEVAPTMHYMMGGIRVNQNCETSLNGLFAAGEAAAGIHGANRLGGNSLADILVFGKIAGESAANYSRQLKHTTISDKIVEKEIKRLMLFFSETGSRPSSIKSEIQEFMWKHVGIMRNESGLKLALKRISELKKIKLMVRGSMNYNHDWIDAIQIPSMLVTCESIVRSALKRTESRGAHSRMDYPKKNDKKWLVNVVCKKEKKKMNVKTYPVSKLDSDMKRLMQ